METIQKPSDIDNYYVRQQARKLVSEHAQMNRTKGKTEGAPLSLNRGCKFSEEDMSSIIDADIVKSKSKCKTWKQLDMYLKWQAIVSYLVENGMKEQSEQDWVKIMFQSGKIAEIVFDPKQQKVTKMDIPSKKQSKNMKTT